MLGVTRDAQAASIAERLTVRSARQQGKGQATRNGTLERLNMKRETQRRQRRAELCLCYSSDTFQIYISATEGFRSQFPAVLGPDKNSVSLTPVEPVQLASVFLRAHDEQSYAYACEDEQRFLETLSAGQRILRQGSTLLVNKPLSHKPQVNGHLHNAAINGHSHGTGPIDEPVLRYTVIMAEPVLQGYIQPEVCQITLTPPGTSSDVEVEGLHTAETSKTRPTFDVNEDFLAASLLDDPDEAAFGSLVRVAAPSEQSQPSQSAILSGRKVKPIPLDVRPPLDEIHEDNSEDTELQIFVTSAEIARYGFFSGDYVGRDLPRCLGAHKQRRFMLTSVSDSGRGDQP